MGNNESKAPNLKQCEATVLLGLQGEAPLGANIPEDLPQQGVKIL